MIINNPALERLGYLGFNVSDALNEEMNWLSRLFEARHRDFRAYPISQLAIPPKLAQNITQYGNIVSQCAFEARVIIAMALAVHIRPSVYDIFF